MLDERQTKTVLLFFALSCLDDKKAFQCAEKAVVTFKSRLRSLPRSAPVSDTNVLLIQSCLQQTAGLKKDKGQRRPFLSPSMNQKSTLLSGILDEDWARWSSFHATSTFDERTAVLLTKILGFSKEEIAMALNVTEGTISYRVGRGLRKLGELVYERRT